MKVNFLKEQFSPASTVRIIFDSQTSQGFPYSALRFIETGIPCTTFATIPFYHHHPVTTFRAFHLNFQATIWAKEFDILQWSTVKKFAYVSTASWARLFWVSHLNTIFVLSSQMVYGLSFISLFSLYK